MRRHSYMVSSEILTPFRLVTIWLDFPQKMLLFLYKTEVIAVNLRKWKIPQKLLNRFLVLLILFFFSLKKKKKNMQPIWGSVKAKKNLRSLWNCIFINTFLNLGSFGKLGFKRCINVVSISKRRLWRNHHTQFVWGISVTSGIQWMPAMPLLFLHA